MSLVFGAYIDATIYTDIDTSWVDRQLQADRLTSRETNRGRQL